MHITKDERPSEPRLKTAVYFSLYFSVAMAGQLGDIRVRHRPALRSSKPAGDLTDTMTDIICGTVGAVMTAAAYYGYKARKRAAAVSSEQKGGLPM
ncbi:hypothetical protein LJK88_32090 [Paenibacillus sp. P26]|nr:hypothetical protein LJK88_32090 [Paenibacillus sp. P26]